MTALRVPIGVISALLTIGWAALLVIAGGLYSWNRAGSGSTKVAGTMLAVGVPALALAILVTTFVPSARGFLHAVAVVVLLCCAGLVWVAKESPGTAVFGFAFLGLSLVYYRLAVWR